MAAVTICSDFGAQKNKVWHYFHFFPSICHEVMGLDAIILVFWMLSFKSAFSLIKRLFSSSSIYAIRVESYVYLMLLIFFLTVLIPTYDSSSPAFHMMYSAYKLKKQADNIHPWCTPFPIWNQSVVPCLVLTVASWPVYRFLRGRSDGLVCPSLKEFSTVCCDPQQRLSHSQWSRRFFCFCFCFFF